MARKLSSSAGRFCGGVTTAGLSLHVIEPTLNSEAGHCYSFIESLCAAPRPDGLSFSIWAGRSARLSAIAGPETVIVPYFYRRTRRLQELILLRKLLVKPGKIFISTAGRTDLVLIRAAASGEIPSEKVFMYFHWLKLTDKKAAFFRKVANQHPGIQVMGPTMTVVSELIECGFKNAEQVPYPMNRRAAPGPREFNGLLYAGAARPDKGFSRIVDLVEHLAASGAQIPVRIQTSSDHGRRLDPATMADLDRLRKTGYPALEEYPDTLADESYESLFPGGICLQPYDRVDFADRISGITLDALSMGCPVIATSGTWIAGVICRFDAGVVLDDPEPASMLSAVDLINNSYGDFSRRAAAAGAVMQGELSAGHLLARMVGDQNTSNPDPVREP